MTISQQDVMLAEDIPQALKAVRERITPPDRWTQWTFFRDESKEEVYSLNEAYSCCLHGAVRLVVDLLSPPHRPGCLSNHALRLNSHLAHLLTLALRRVDPERNFTTYIMYNDAVDHRSVLRLLEVAEEMVPEYLKAEGLA